MVGGGAMGTAAALEGAGEPFRYLDLAEVRERWPALRLPEGEEVFVQEDGGVVMAERTVLAQARLARGLGAAVLEETPVERLSVRDDGVEVRAGGEIHRAAVAVVTAGSWAAGLLFTPYIGEVLAALATGVEPPPFPRDRFAASRPSLARRPGDRGARAPG